MVCVFIHVHIALSHTFTLIRQTICNKSHSKFVQRRCSSENCVWPFAVHLKFEINVIFLIVTFFNSLSETETTKNNHDFH